MAKDVDAFEDKIIKILNNELPNLTEEGYKVALSRDMKKTGEKLVSIYREVMDEVKE